MERIMDERSAAIKIGGQEYPLLLSTLATKQIAKRFGGLEELSDKLMKTENFESALDEYIWLIMVLANQPIMIHNLWNPEDKKPLLTEEMLDLMTSPFELAEYKDAIMDCMFKGMERHVVSEDSGPNQQAG